MDENISYIPNAVVFRDKNGDTWTSAHNIAKLIGKDNAKIDTGVYKSVHKDRSAKYKMNFEHTDLWINKDATECLLMFCFAPFDLQKAFIKLFAEINSDKDAWSISVYFDENWNMNNKWVGHLPLTAGPVERTIVDGKDGFYYGEHGLTQMSTEPLSAQELEEWEELRLADKKDAAKKEASELFKKYKNLQKIAKEKLELAKTDRKNAKTLHQEASDLLEESRKVATDLFIAETKYTYPADFHPGHAEKFQKMVQLYADWYDGKIGSKASVADK